jgi:release factor glutamine methyltransferase
MPQPDAWTIGRLLEWTGEYLKQHGSETPRLDAEVLLAHARGCPRIALYTAFDEPVAEGVRSAFRELVRRRAEGMPVAYLVGQREFYSLPFRVTPDVLIPRPETELLVVTLLDLVKARRKALSAAGPLSVADIGTGSGIIAVCAARHADCQVTATDISPAALAVARENVERLGVGQKVELIESDLFERVPDDRRFDLVASNPPYVSEAELALLARDVREHEPRAALVAGLRGTEVIERLIPQAADRLLTGGSLLIEISPMIEQAARELVARDERLTLGPTVKDLAGQPRLVQAVRR